MDIHRPKQPNRLGYVGTLHWDASHNLKKDKTVDLFLVWIPSLNFIFPTSYKNFNGEGKNNTHKKNKTQKPLSYCNFPIQQRLLGLRTG